MRKHRKRPQSPKPNRHANPAYHEAMVEIRRSSAAQPHRNRSKYHRPSERRQEWF